MNKTVRTKQEPVARSAGTRRAPGKRDAEQKNAADEAERTLAASGKDTEAGGSEQEQDIFTPSKTIGARCRQIMTNPAARAGALSSAATVVAGLAGFLGSPVDASVGFEISRTVHQISNEPCVQQVDRNQVVGERLLDNCQAVLHALDSNPRLATLPKYGEFRADIQDHYDAANRSYGNREKEPERYLEDLGRFVDRVNQWVNSPDVQGASKEAGGLLDVLGQVNVLLVILTSLVGVITGRQVNRAADQS